MPNEDICIYDFALGWESTSASACIFMAFRDCGPLVGVGILFGASISHIAYRSWHHCHILHCNERDLYFNTAWHACLQRSTNATNARPVFPPKLNKECNKGQATQTLGAIRRSLRRTESILRLRLRNTFFAPQKIPCVDAMPMSMENFRRAR
jgi:hypothetical protein